MAKIVVNGKTLGETNHPDTATTSGTLVSGRLVLLSSSTTGSLITQSSPSGRECVITIDSSGNYKILELPSDDVNRILAIDGNGNFYWEKLVF